MSRYVHLIIQLFPRESVRLFYSMRCWTADPAAALTMITTANLTAHTRKRFHKPLTSPTNNIARSNGAALPYRYLQRKPHLFLRSKDLRNHLHESGAAASISQDQSLSFISRWMLTQFDHVVYQLSQALSSSIDSGSSAPIAPYCIDWSVIDLRETSVGDTQ